MKKPVRNILIYADGHTEDIKHDLVGDRFIRTENIDGELWEREFQCSGAYLDDEDDPMKLKSYVLVGLERRFFRRYTAQEWQAQQARWREESMGRILRKILDAPRSEQAERDR